MNRKLPLLVAVAALAALLVPTAAFPFGGDADTELHDIAMAPSDGPNGVYAEMDDGEVRLDLSESNQQLAGDGLNENSITQIDNVFTVTYTGPQNATVWLTHEGDGESLSFYRSGEPSQLVQGEEWSVILETNETLRVGILADTTEPDHGIEGIETFTVHAEIPEDVSLSVETDRVAGVDDTSATLAGELETLGGAAEASVSFEYRASGETGWNTLQATTMTEPGSVDRVLTGLAPGTTYEFRAVAETSGSSATGAIETFTTNGPEQPRETPTETPPEQPPETPTETPTEQPPETPTDTPTEQPPETPTEQPPETPTETPTEQPPETPTETPTEQPPETPTETPPEQPPETPTEQPPETPTETPTEQPPETPTETPTEGAPETEAGTPTEGSSGGPTGEATPTPTPTPTPPIDEVPAQTRTADGQDPDQGGGVTLGGTDGGLGVLAGVVSNTFLLLLLALLLGLLVSRAVRELADEED